MAKELIHTRKVVFTPSVDIKTEQKNTKVSITCIDKDGKIVKRTTDESEDEVIDDGTGSLTPDPSQSSLTPDPSPTGEGE